MAIGEAAGRAAAWAAPRAVASTRLSAYTATMRTIGPQRRSELEPDPVKAWHRARQLDAMLPAALPPRPRGITRGTHEELARADTARMLEAARRINR